MCMHAAPGVATLYGRPKKTTAGLAEGSPRQQLIGYPTYMNTQLSTPTQTYMRAAPRHGKTSE